MSLNMALALAYIPYGGKRGIMLGYVMHAWRKLGAFATIGIVTVSLTVLAGCAGQEAEQPASGQAAQAEATVEVDDVMTEAVSDVPADNAESSSANQAESAEAKANSSTDAEKRADAEALRAQLGIVEDYRAEFSHGPKGADYQRYIMLHDTESDADPLTIVDYWDGADNGVAAHFVVGKDGTIVQCVPLDEIAHHAGYGDAGHNDRYGLVEDGRDDMVGTVPIGSWAPDYGMNAYSVGIEMVHVGGEGTYPEAQLEAVDALIAYIDAYYGFESEIVDHKAWRTGNSDTSAEFADYLANYQSSRAHA